MSKGMRRDYAYPVSIEPDPDGGVLVTCPDVPEVVAHGADRDAALSNARQALAVALFGYLKEGRPLPQASASGRETIAPQASDVLKIAVVEAWMASGLSKSQFARMLDIDEKEARRILDPDCVTKADRLEQALLLLGRRLHIAVEAA
jgi:antitoxin HicB